MLKGKGSSWLLDDQEIAVTGSDHLMSLCLEGGIEAGGERRAADVEEIVECPVSNIGLALIGL